MLTLGGMVLLIGLSALIGKHAKGMSFSAYVIIAIIAIIQVGLVLYDIFTMQLLLQ